MGVPTLEVGYTSATTGREDPEVHKGHVVALGKGELGSERQITVLLDRPQYTIVQGF
jgi:hypothetical protein